VEEGKEEGVNKDRDVVAPSPKPIEGAGKDPFTGDVVAPMAGAKGASSTQETPPLEVEGASSSFSYEDLHPGE